MPHQIPGLAKAREARALQENFFAQLAPPQQLHRIFEHLPNIHFFVKDQGGHFVTVSRPTLKTLGMKSEEEVIGRTDFDLYPREMAANFRKDDDIVLATGQPLLGRVEIWFDQHRMFDWFVTSKFPLFGPAGQVVGIMGVVQSLEEQRELIFSDKRLRSAVRYIQKHFRQKLDLEDLSHQVNLSARQLRRQFQEAFSMSPQEFLLKTRLQAACKALLQTDQLVSEIALENGFSDQSSFTLHFRRALGVTPLQFRRRERGG